MPPATGRRKGEAVNTVVGSDTPVRSRAIRAMTRLAGLTLVVIAVVAMTAAAEAPGGSTAGSTVVRIFAPRGEPGTRCERVYPLKRIVSKPRVLSGAMRALVAGPTRAERAGGYAGWFSWRTVGAFRSARVAGRVAYVDFRNFSRAIPNASTSCGSALLLAQLDRTARQFPTVDRAVYSFDGSRRAFYEWLQRSSPDRQQRR